MEKTKVEELIERKLGQRFEVDHKGNHRWEGTAQPATPANCGVFAAVFATVTVRVDAPPCGDEFTDWNVFRVSVNWTHRSGGSNGADLDLFYNHRTDELLSRDEANDRYWANKTGA